MFDLLRLERLAQAPSVAVVSMDLFDTLLLRGTRPELARFRDIAEGWHRALRDQGLASPGAAALYNARLREHKAAYDRIKPLNGRAEVRHGDVLAAITHGLGLAAPAGDVMAAAELAYEIRAVRLNTPLASLLLRLARDREVVFASDMYLSGEALRRLLAAKAPRLAGFPLFVSSDLGLTKRHGTLFPHLAEAMGVAPGAILHTGDNRLSDVENPQAAGFSAVFLPRSWPWRWLHGLRQRYVRSVLTRRHQLHESPP